MSAEEALLKLLQGPLIQYEKLKFSSQEESVHPEMIIAMAAMDRGWKIAIEKSPDHEHLRGISVGTAEYLQQCFKK